MTGYALLRGGHLSSLSERVSPGADERARVGDDPSTRAAGESDQAQERADRVRPCLQPAGDLAQRDSGLSIFSLEKPFFTETSMGREDKKANSFGLPGDSGAGQAGGLHTSCGLARPRIAERGLDRCGAELVHRALRTSPPAPAPAPTPPPTPPPALSAHRPHPSPPYAGGAGQDKGYCWGQRGGRGS
jgi:hypothetical protein